MGGLKMGGPLYHTSLHSTIIGIQCLRSVKFTVKVEMLSGINIHLFEKFTGSREFKFAAKQ